MLTCKGVNELRDQEAKLTEARIGKCRPHLGGEFIGCRNVLPAVRMHQPQQCSITGTGGLAFPLS